MRRRKKALNSIIKMRRHRLDLIRKDLAQQQAMYDETEEIIDSTKQSMSDERRLVATDPAYFQSLGVYLSSAERKVDLYSHQLNNLSVGLEATRERLGEAFQDAKRFEIALEAHVHKERYEEKAKERKQMDEIGARKRTD